MTHYTCYECGYQRYPKLPLVVQNITRRCAVMPPTRALRQRANPVENPAREDTQDEHDSLITNEAAQLVGVIGDVWDISCNSGQAHKLG